MFTQERRRAILKIVHEHRRLSFADLQRRVSVSAATLRRDLTALEQGEDIIRVHGGVIDPGYFRSEISFDERILRHSSAKKAMAKKAASLVPIGASVFVDAGSTCLEAGKALLGRRDVRIITHSVALLAEARRGEAAIVCLGGELRKVSGALVGGHALGALALIHTDLAFLGASGLDLEGCSTTELTEANMKKSILCHAKRRILLADFSKWQKPSAVRFASWSDFDDWIVERTLSTNERSMLPASLTIH